MYFCDAEIAKKKKKKKIPTFTLLQNVRTDGLVQTLFIQLSSSRIILCDTGFDKKLESLYK